MSFDVPAAAYCQFMARYSEPLAVRFADLAGVQAGQLALDVGCGPGALTAELVRRLGAGHVRAVEPSGPFAAAARERLPDVRISQAAAERLPFADDSFDVTMAQLVASFMTDAVTGLREMARVTRPGGVVAACVWDRGGGRSPMSLFWQTVQEFDPAAFDGIGVGPGASEGDLPALFAGAGLHEIRPASLTVTVGQVPFGQWWEPFLMGVGPGGDYVLSLDDTRRDRLREQFRQVLAAGPAEVSATAWVATGLA